MNKSPVIILLILILSACGVSSEKYEILKKETAALQLKVDSLQAVVSELQKTTSILVNQAQLQVKTGQYQDAKQTLLRITGNSVTSQQKRDALILLAVVNGKLEDIAYNTVSGSKDVASYKNFIKNYPKSKYTKRVKTKIKKLTTPAVTNISRENVNKSENSLNGSKDISNELNHRNTETDNWSTRRSSEHPKSNNRTTNYTTRVGAICRDGTRSYATGRGACSHHGGVSEWLYE